MNTRQERSMFKSNSKYKNDFEAFFCKTLGYNIMADNHQYEFVKAIIDPVDKAQVIFSDSIAGSGKSSLALSAAYYLIKEEMANSIVYVRNTVSVRENGFLPGTVEEKEMAYMKPAVDIINRIGARVGNQDLYGDMVMSEQIQCTSTSFLRGVDYEGPLVLIIDEAQNLDMIELQTVLTRPHDSVKVVVIGSSLQNDNQKIRKYGTEKLLPFQVYAKHFMEQESIPARSINLVNNYRGKLSQLADMIEKTTRRVEQGDSSIYQEDTAFYGPTFNSVQEALYSQRVLERVSNS